MSEGQFYQRIKNIAFPIEGCEHNPVLGINNIVEILEDFKADFRRAIYGEANEREILHKWFGRFDEERPGICIKDTECEIPQSIRGCKTCVFNTLNSSSSSKEAPHV